MTRHLKGLARCWLWTRIYLLISCHNSSTLQKESRSSKRRSSWESQLSAALSQEALVGAKCKWNHGLRASQLESLSETSVAVRPFPQIRIISAHSAIALLVLEVCNQNCRIFRSGFLW